MSWIMAAGLIVNAAMGVSHFPGKRKETIRRNQIWLGRSPESFESFWRCWWNCCQFDSSRCEFFFASRSNLLKLVSLFKDCRSTSDGRLCDSNYLLWSIDFFVWNVCFDEMWKILGTYLFGLHYSLHVKKTTDREEPMIFIASWFVFRYGLSITFFIIIGDQLDQCTSILDDRSRLFFLVFL